MEKGRLPHPIDVHVGRRVRVRRVMRDMTQSALAEQIGLTFQQLQKYESGANRISASRLWQIAQILDVTVTWFFEGLDDNAVTVEELELSDTKILEMVKIVQKLPADIRKHVHALLTAVGKHMDTGNA